MMTKKSLIPGGLLFISMLCLAGSKTYDVTFEAPSTVGNVTLAAGDYKVKVDGANAVFTNGANACPGPASARRSLRCRNQLQQLLRIVQHFLEIILVVSQRRSRNLCRHACVPMP